jgi:hypothetical protein
MTQRERIAMRLYYRSPFFQGLAWSFLDIFQAMARDICLSLADALIERDGADACFM